MHCGASVEFTSEGGSLPGGVTCCDFRRAVTGWGFVMPQLDSEAFAGCLACVRTWWLGRQW